MIEKNKPAFEVFVVEQIEGMQRPTWTKLGGLWKNSSEKGGYSGHVYGVGRVVLLPPRKEGSEK